MAEPETTMIFRALGVHALFFSHNRRQFHCQVLFVIAMLAAVASASDVSQYREQEQQEEDIEHTPYQYSYAVDDDTVFSHSEQGDEEGDVTGEYSVYLPDGRVQTVSYSAGDQGGYTAEVSYEGEAQYPEQPSYQSEQEQEEEEEEEEEEEDKEEGGDEELIPIYAYRPVYN